MPGQEPYVRHTWLLVDDAVVDLTADPFGEAPVAVGSATAFHDSLDMREEAMADSVLAGLSADESQRLHRLLTPIEARLPTFTVRSDAGA